MCLRSCVLPLPREPSPAQAACRIAACDCTRQPHPAHALNPAQSSAEGTPEHSFTVHATCHAMGGGSRMWVLHGAASAPRYAMHCNASCRMLHGDGFHVSCATHPAPYVVGSAACLSSHECCCARSMSTPHRPRHHPRKLCRRRRPLPPALRPSRAPTPRPLAARTPRHRLRARHAGRWRR